MVERRGCVGFALEAFQRLRIARQIFRKKLKRDEPVQPRVLAFIDNAHAAAAEELDDAVVPEHRAGTYPLPAHCGAINEASRNIMGGEQGFQFLAQFSVIASRVSQEVGAALLRQLQRQLQQCFYTLPTLRSHNNREMRTIPNTRPVRTA